MTATLLSGPDQKEGLSLAYVKALAARAGFSTAVPEPDRDSVDVRIMAGGLRRPTLGLQLKATADHIGRTSELSRSRRPAEQRRTAVLASLEAKPGGGGTTHAAKRAAEPLGGIATVCTVTHYCRTTVFEYPGCHMSTEVPVPPLMIAEDEAFRAAVVSDLPAYFQQNVFPHYAVDVSLRDRTDRVYRETLNQSKLPNPPIFLVTEEYKAIQATQFANGECFLIDEWRDGEALIEGGRAGKRALLAFKTINGAWPDFSRDSHAVNTVLAAVKVEQNVTHHLNELCSCTCFVSDDKRAVYMTELTMTVSYGGVRVSSPVDTDGLRRRVAGVRSIYDGLRQDSLKTPQVAELVDAILLDKTQDDAHFRLWYLRLWQAVVDAKRILGRPKLEGDANAIAGNLTAIQLKEYRDRIAHWWTGKVDFSFVTGIQQTVQELMRRKYRKVSE